MILFYILLSFKILNFGGRTHATPLFNDLKILRLEQLHYIAVQMFMYKFYHKILPDIFSNFFKLNSEIHSYNTRQQLPRPQLVVYAVYH